MGNVADIINRCRSLGDETEWFEYKQGDAVDNADDIGEYISALSNGAAMQGESFGYLIWGIDNDTHKYTNTKFNYQKDVNHEPFQHYLSRYVTPTIYPCCKDSADCIQRCSVHPYWFKQGKAQEISGS